MFHSYLNLPDGICIHDPILPPSAMAHHQHQALTQGQHRAIHVSQQSIRHISKGPIDQQLQPAEEDTCLNFCWKKTQLESQKESQKDVAWIWLVNLEEDVPNLEMV